MKKLSISIFLVLIFTFSCAKKLPEIRYYPNRALFFNEKAKIIVLDSTVLNFKQITDKIGTYYKEYAELVLEFNDGNITKRLIPFVFDGGLIKDRDILTITTDSILKDNGYSVSELERILRKHYTNNSKDYNYPESPYNNLVKVCLDTNSSGDVVRQNLIRLTKTFDKLKNELQDSIKLRVYFDYSRQLPKPPPPED